jgi:hypothetical protein
MNIGASCEERVGQTLDLSPAAPKGRLVKGSALFYRIDEYLYLGAISSRTVLN